MTRLVITLSVLLSLLLNVAGLAAQTSDEALISRGVQLRREHRDVEALEAFRQANQARPSARALAQIGLAEQALGAWVQAESDLTQALARDDDAWIQLHSAVLRDALTQIQGKLAWLSVKSNAGAQVLLNDALVGTLPMAPLRIPSGRLRLELRLREHAPVVDTLDVPAGTTLVQHVQFALVPSSTLASGSPSLPKAGTEPKAGTVLTRPALPPARTQTTLAWTSLGATCGFLATALVAQVVRQQSVAHYDDDNRCFYGNLSRDERCGVYRGRAETAETTAIAAYAATALLGTLSAVLFLTAPSERGSSVVAPTRVSALALRFGLREAGVALHTQLW